VFVQISDENIHRVHALLDELFGRNNFVGLIPFTKTGGQADGYLASICDFLLWYARDHQRMVYHPLYMQKRAGEQGASKYDSMELLDGQRVRMTEEQQAGKEPIPSGARVCTSDHIISQEYRPDTTVNFEHNGIECRGLKAQVVLLPVRCARAPKSRRSGADGWRPGDFNASRGGP